MPATKQLVDKFSETLRSLFPRYEKREPQISFYQEIYQALDQAEYSLIELATGEGKSSALLIAALDFLHSSPQHKIVIATSTKKLQKQLQSQFNELAPIYDSTHKAKTLFGKSNYLCAHKVETHQHHHSQLNSKLSQDIDTLKVWASQTPLAQIDQLHFEIDQKAWKTLSPQKESCPPQHCSEKCSFKKARNEAQEASIIITNHSRLLEDLKLPKEQRFSQDRAIIIDEAAELYKALHQSQTLSFCPEEELKQNHSYQVSHSLQVLAQDSRQFLHQNPGVQSQHPFDLDLSELYQHADERLKTKLTPFLDSNAVTWLDFDEHFHAPTFHSFPGVWTSRPRIEITNRNSGLFQNHSQSVIYCGANLQSENFETLNNLKINQKIHIPSSYKLNDKIQTFIYPELPAIEDPNFTEASHQKFLELNSLSQGRKLVLFNSYSSLEKFYRTSQQYTHQSPILRQSKEFSNQQLIEQFTQIEKATLLATQSFFIGIDFPNNLLQEIYLMRLPFENPDAISPQIKDRICKEHQLHPFRDSALPDAITLFRQAAGRLIRHSQDTGTLHIFDKRIVDKSYGSLFLDSLKL